MVTKCGCMTDDKLIWIKAPDGVSPDVLSSVRDHLEDSIDECEFIISYGDIEPLSKDEIREMLNEL